MNYKIGDKVETPFGVGIITHIDEFDNEIKEDIYWVQIKKAPEIYFNEEHLQYYKTAHDKLLELYIDLANTIEVLDNAYGYGIFEFNEIKYICGKIKELEND